MEKNILTEEQVKEVLDKIIEESLSKVSRQDFSRIQFKIDELLNALNDASRELIKLDSTLPDALKYVAGKRLAAISFHLSSMKSEAMTIKNNVTNYKRQFYARQLEEKKKLSN